MFYNLNGTVAELSADHVVIECGGVGYEAAITPNTASALTIGEAAKIYVSESIGEDHFDLFGFRNLQEKRFFRMLTGVSGIGPKAAMSILSYNTPEALALAIVNGNEKALTACPGIGKKIAQRVILELKDKLAKSGEVPDAATAAGASTAAILPKASGGAYDDALTALAVLGYSTSDVVPVLKQIHTEGMTTEQIIRAVLKFMV